MADVDFAPALTSRKEEAIGWLQKQVSKGLGWARKYSLFTYPYATACCGMEYMSVAASRYDIARFGAEFPRFSPRQADLLMVIGTVNMKQGPVATRSTGRDLLAEMNRGPPVQPSSPARRGY